MAGPSTVTVPARRGWCWPRARPVAWPCCPDRHRARPRSAGRDRRDAPARRIAARARPRLAAGKGRGSAALAPQVPTSPRASCSPPTPWSPSDAAFCRNARPRTRPTPACACSPAARHRVYTGVALVDRQGRDRAGWSRRGCASSACPRGDRRLYRQRRMARQGRRLRHPGPRRRLRVKLVGSYTGVVGLPLAETAALCSTAMVFTASALGAVAWRGQPLDRRRPGESANQNKARALCDLRQAGRSAPINRSARNVAPMSICIAG